ncbi:MAG: phosphatase PAP2 family protein [Rhodomicrobium sp.]
MTAKMNSAFGGVWLAALFLIALPPTLLAHECVGRSDEPLVSLLQPPPCEACEETKAELAELEALEQSRTPEQAAHAASDTERSLPRFLEGTGIGFDADALQACKRFFKKRHKEEKAAVDAAKDTFCRVRPFLTRGNTLHPVQEAKPDASFSYPSGHATYGATVGFLLAEMMPEKKVALYARINDYAHDRMVAGVHFRSDVEAGKLYGAAIVDALFAKPGFEAEFEEAKACVRKAAGLQ